MINPCSAKLTRTGLQVSVKRFNTLKNIYFFTLQISLGIELCMQSVYLFLVIYVSFTTYLKELLRRNFCFVPP